jgi:hypothetical protein
MNLNDTLRTQSPNAIRRDAASNRLCVVCASVADVVGLIALAH